MPKVMRPTKNEPICREIYGKYIGNIWEIYGKLNGENIRHRKVWEIYGKSTLIGGL